MNKDQVLAVKKTFRLLRDVRKRSGTHSTLITVSSFDPSVQSVYSSKDVRRNSNKMAKSISREIAHGDWLRELAARTEEVIYTLPNSLDKKYRLQADVEILEQKARRSDARCQAMLIELKWKMQHDALFAGSASLLARSTLNRYRFDESLKDVPVGNFRKVSKDE